LFSSASSCTRKRLVETERLQRAGIDAGIVGADHAADAGNNPMPAITPPPGTLFSGSGMSNM